MAADPTPMKWWGLDPLHRTHVKLYVADILSMVPAASTPGVYFYRNHAITHVDVMGTVVEVRERESFTAYAIDDGTGVITCLCWKEPERCRRGRGGTLPHSCASQVVIQDLLASVLHREAESSRAQLGDWLHVLGSINCQWETREIHATYYSRVDDPGCVQLIERLREQVRLYTQYYDKEYAWAGNTSQLRGQSDILLSTLCDGILKFLEDNGIRSVYFQELQRVESLAALAAFTERDADRTQMLAHTSSQREKCASHPSSKQEGCVACTAQVTTLAQFRDALCRLEQNGFVYKHPTNNELYLVTDLDVNLRDNVLLVVRGKCTRPASKQSAVSLGDITYAVRNLCGVTVRESHVERALAVLEDKSLVFCKGKDMYIAF